jgi:hypothetical protein
VQKLKSKPFVLLGVNSDPGDKLTKLIDEKKVTWRCFWDDGVPMGPIATRWNVRSWPTVYVIDRRGIIRFKDHHEDIDDLLGKLVNE